MTSQLQLWWKDFGPRCVANWHLSFIVFILCLVCMGWIFPCSGARAEGLTLDNVNSVPLFELHCAGCHPNGGNIIRRGKTLKQRALMRNGYDDAGAIATLITQGKGTMSAFGDKLSPEEIQALAQYVLDRAAVNWRS